MSELVNIITPTFFAILIGYLVGKFRNEAEMVSSVVALTTLVSLVSIPVLLNYPG